MDKKKDIPMSKWPHLRRQYKEYKRKQIMEGKNPKTWEQWMETKPKVKSIVEKRKQRNKGGNNAR